MLNIAACSDNTHRASKLRIAVASNFQVPMSALIEEYKLQNPDVNISVSSASSGVLLAQIKRGAPFELFFSADSERPQILAQELDLIGRVHTYAIGQLVLWAPEMTEITIESVAKLDRKFAIAQPELAPYGLATKQVLEKSGVWESTQANIAFGNNVTQVEHFIRTGAVSAGFLSLAQVMHSNVDMRHVWVIPPEDYDPIEQKVILLNQEKNKNQSESFLNFVLSEPGQTIIKRLGYAVVARGDNER